MQRRTLALLSLAFVSGIGLSGSSAGCIVPNPDHCYNNGGDSHCEAQHPDWATAYCTDNSCVTPTPDWCVEALPPDECWYCNGAEGQDCSDVADDTDTDTDTGTDSTDTDTDTSETETMETSDTDTTGPECMSSEECSGDTPLCDGGSCVSCVEAVDATCVGDYPDTPACGASGECVECTLADVTACSGETPTCGYEEACVGCWEHSQCPESACNMSTGACMDPQRVWWVDGAAADGGDGLEATPYDTIQDALANVGEEEEGTIYLVESLYGSSVVVDPTRTIAIVGVGLPSMDVTGTAVTVEGGAVLMMDSVTIEDSATAVRNSGEFWGTRLRILDNSTEGLRADNGEAHLINSFAGGVAAGGPAVNVIAGTVNVRYSTLVTGGGGAPFSCFGVSSQGSTIVNSLIASTSDGDSVVNCADLSVETSALDQDVGGTNTNLMTFDPAWFDAFFGGVFLLTDQAPAELVTAATWNYYDPTTDIDGDPRPTEAGAPDYAGADRLP